MNDIYTAIIEARKEKLGLALCTIVHTTGSSARKAGTKMLVKSDGSILGTIGGGNLEKTIIAEALKAIEKATPVKYHFDFEEDLDMTCGGTTEVFIEPLQNIPTLLIFGAGHVGKALGKLAADYSFKVRFIDSREGIIEANSWFADKIIIGDYESIIPTLEFTENTYIVILTHQHGLDEKILHMVINQPHRYLGMIGSKSKIAIARKNLESKGVSRELLNGVNMPIGIKFNAQTPEEIALSILAKLIDVKNSH